MSGHLVKSSDHVRVGGHNALVVLREDVAGEKLVLLSDFLFLSGFGLLHLLDLLWVDLNVVGLIVLVTVIKTLVIEGVSVVEVTLRIALRVYKP